jgi:hypothetical protein
MSIVQDVEKLTQQRGNYEVARFNALRHGVLSRHTVLPWENGDEYRALIEALVVEHEPRGPTEEHLVEELAGIVWRKRRLRLAEGAAHDGEESVGEAIRATESQTAEGLADLEGDQAMTEAALRLLAKPSSSAYSRALDALREDTREWWEDRLTWEQDDYDEDQTPYRADGKDLKRFLESEVLPCYEKRGRELNHRPMIRAQAFGQAIDPHRLERLARYEVHLDRKLERMLAMLLRLKDLRADAVPR